METIEFKKYNSIENSYQWRFVEKCIYNLDGYNDFIVQEKIHGSNFSFYVSESGIKCAKRTGFIEEWESFFDYKKVLEDNSFALIELQKEIGKDIIVFWELFGSNVQKEVYYCDDTRFYAFDIVVDWEYLSLDECNILFDRVWILYAKVLQRWTLEECFTYDINRDSILAFELTGKTDFKDRWWNNIMEWVVIRPNESKWIWHIDNTSRVIFKKKTELFSEKKAPDKIPSNPAKFQMYDLYITKPRLNNIISKYWEITDKKDLAKFAWYLVKDICEDYEKDTWELDEWISKYLHSKCIKFILSELF